ncbi:hypothetical protein AB6A23_05405 [Paenibacillus tarimensis]
MGVARLINPNKKVSLSIAFCLILGSILFAGRLQETTLEKPNGALTTDKDVTSTLEVLGRPFSKPAYARNVWDMQVFEGKIYMGHGNSSNLGPSPNAGPVPVYYYDPVTDKFIVQDVVSPISSTKTTEIKKYVDEEQIDIFKVFNGTLYIPGHDPRRESWEYGNYYKLSGDNWVKYRNVPKGIHVYDMAYYNGKLFAALGGRSSEVLMSEDDGVTWEKIGVVSESGPPRAYTLFEFKNKLYAVSAIIPQNNIWPDAAEILTISESKKKENLEAVRTTVYGSKMFPDIIKDGAIPYMRMVRTSTVKDKLLYIAGEIHNDHQWIPQGLFVATDLGSARGVIFPNADALPMDILVRGDQIYVLAYVKNSSRLYTNMVYKIKAKDLDKDANWIELFRFSQDTFARSFEELNGDFYFGLGSDVEPLSESSGTILRVRSNLYQN